jgi:GNAT superfamily N-acetyltransferase
MDSMIEKIVVRPLTAQETRLESSALELLNRTQGVGLFSSNYLQRRFQNPESVVLAAFYEQELIGISIAEIIHKFDFYLPFNSRIEDELNNKRVGSFATLSVTEAFLGKGIGSLLCEKRLKWLKSKGCEVVLGVSWVSGFSYNSARTFERTGFTAIAKVDDFFEKSSLEHPFDCPGCHHLPCTCSAILYRLDL